jgi:hypothetical protein
MTRGHRQGFLGTGFHAVATGDAPQPVNGPFLLRPIHQQRAGGAFFGADVAIDAVVLRENQLPARARDGIARFKGLAGGRRLCERPLQGQFGHFKITHITFPYN